MTEHIRHLEQQVAILKEANNAMADAYPRGRKEGRLELADETLALPSEQRTAHLRKIVTKHEEEACRSEG